MIKKELLIKLGFEEYEEWYYSLCSDLGNLEYHMNENKIWLNWIEAECLWEKHIKNIVELYNWLAYMIIDWETIINLEE